MSRADPLPPVEDVLPHAGGMVFLSRVLSHERHRTVCEVEIDRQSLLGDVSGGVPAWIGLEYMAQCVAAHGGVAARRTQFRRKPCSFRFKEVQITIRVFRRPLAKVVELGTPARGAFSRLQSGKG